MRINVGGGGYNSRMNETMTSDRLAELTMLELLAEMNSRLASVKNLTELTKELVEQSDSLGQKVAFASFLTTKIEPMLAEVQTLMAEYNSRLAS